MSKRNLTKMKRAARKAREATTTNNKAVEERNEAVSELARLRSELNAPHVNDFLEAVRLEAVHQRERWEAEGDAGKQPTDWLFLVGYLAGKGCTAAIQGDRDKALHHTISTAAVCLNWHAHITGESTRFRPGKGNGATKA